MAAFHPATPLPALQGGPVANQQNRIVFPEDLDGPNRDEAFRMPFRQQNGGMPTVGAPMPSITARAALEATKKGTTENPFTKH